MSEPAIPAAPVTDPGTEAQTYDRYGCVRLSVDVDKSTGVWGVGLTPCLGSKGGWRAANEPEIRVDNLLAELMAIPDDSPDKLPALMAAQRIAADVLTVQKALMLGRGLL